MTIQELVKAMRDMRESGDIKEKRFGDVSSFNFSKRAFYGRRWNEYTTKARGLFIDTRENRIVARGYEKFFNYGENEFTSPESLKEKLMFPLRVFRKENGYLGLIGWDRQKDDFVFCSKSMYGAGDYAEKLKEIFYTSGIDYHAAKDLVKTIGVTIVVEVIDPDFDPHIIEYPRRKLVLLDLIYNDLSGATMFYDVVQNYWAPKLRMEVKEFCGYIKDWDDLQHAIELVDSEDYREGGAPVEGYVIQDVNDFMFKLKTGYYRKWKRYRALADAIIKNPEMPVPISELDDFLMWVFCQKDHLKEESIINMRNMYEKERVE